MGKGRSNKGASAISDRSGFKFPMSEMVIEPGTNYLVHRSESDGQWSENLHPLNNLAKHLRGKQGDPFPVKNARPEQTIEGAIPQYSGTANFFNNVRLQAQGDVLNTGIAVFTASSNMTSTANLNFQGEAIFTGTSSFSTTVLPNSLQEVVSSTIIDLDTTNSNSVAFNAQREAFNLVDPASNVFQLGTNFFYNNIGTPNGELETTGGVDIYFRDGDIPLIKSFHKSNNASWWIAVSLRYKPSGFGTIFSTMGSSANEGIELLMASNSDLRFNVDRNKARVNNSVPYRPTGNEDVIVIISHNHLTDSAKIWIADTAGGNINGGLPYEFADIHPQTSTVDASDRFNMLRRASGSLACNIGTKFYGLAIGTSDLTQQEAEDIIETMGLRRGLSNYA